MKGVIDWPRYSRWTWIIAVLLVVLLLLLWWLDRGPGSAIACCGEPLAPGAPTAPGEEPAARVGEPLQPTMPGLAGLTFVFEDGKWVLDGAVPDEATKDRLLEAAVATYGEEAVVDRLRVDAAADASPCADRPRELFDWLRAASTVGIACDGNAVSLTGTVPGDEEKAAHGRWVRDFFGADTRILNELQVAAPVQPAAEPTARVSERLQPQTSGPAGLTFVFEDGKWVLDGAVPDEATEDRLLEAAAATYGEETVVDRLRIDDDADASPCANRPGELFARLRDAFTVGIACDGNTISLTGTVPNDEEKAAHRRWVRDFFGPGTHIVNELQVVAPVQSVAEAEDAQCADLVAAAPTFAFGSSEIDTENRELLDAIAPCLQDGQYEVSGHTDNIGSAEANVRLSRARADTVRRYLIERGVSGDNLTAQGYGEDEPIADNATEEGRARNRRVELSKR